MYMFLLVLAMSPTEALDEDPAQGLLFQTPGMESRSNGKLGQDPTLQRTGSIRRWAYQLQRPSMPTLEATWASHMQGNGMATRLRL